MPNATAAEKAEFARILARDMMIFDKPELEMAWDEAMRRAAEVATGTPWAELVPDAHNPIYYIAEKVVFANVKGDNEYLYAPTHRDRLARALLDYYRMPPGQEKAGFLVLMQRDSFKSTFMHIVMPIFVAIREKRLLNRETRILLVHYKLLQASMNLVRLKNVLANSEFLRWTYPEWCLETAEVGTKDSFFFPGVTPGAQGEPSVMAIGITGDVTGLHFNHIFFSDLVTKEARTSKVIREQVEAMHEAMLYTLSVGKNKRWYDGTPYHIHDLWAKMLAANIEGKPLYIVQQIPAWDEMTDTYSLPYRHTPERLEFMRQEEISRTGNDFMFCLQMLLQSKSTRFIAGDRRWYRYCHRDEVPHSAWYVILCDPAWKGTHNSGQGDYASIQVWAFEVRGVHLFSYLVDGVHSNMMTPLDGEHEICRLMDKWDIMDVGVEEHGGTAFRTSLQGAADKRGLYINIIDFKSKTTAKQSRMSTFLKDVEAGLCFICEEVPEDVKDALLEQTDEFPQCIDELCDALDAAAYSRDPNVVNEYMPQVRRRLQTRGYRAPEAAFERRTRHCGN